MDKEDLLRELRDIQKNPDSLLENESEFEIVLKEIIKIERRHLYGLDSTSNSKRQNAIHELLNDSLKNKGI
jgi:hypothetical protein